MIKEENVHGQLAQSLAHRKCSINDSLFYYSQTEPIHHPQNNQQSSGHDPEDGATDLACAFTCFSLTASQLPVQKVPMPDGLGRQ